MQKRTGICYSLLLLTGKNHIRDKGLLHVVPHRVSLAVPTCSHNAFAKQMVRWEVKSGRTMIQIYYQDQSRPDGPQFWRFTDPVASAAALFSSSDE